MREDQRQFYLSALGISSWYARKALPGAAASPEFDFGPQPEPAPDPVTVQQRVSVKARPAMPPSQARGRQGMASVREALDEVPAHRGNDIPAEAKSEPGRGVASALDGSAQANKQDEPTESVNAANEPTPEVHALVCYGPYLNLAADLSDDASLAVQRTLAENILRALSQTAGSTLEFRWPVFSKPDIPGNDSDGFGSVCTRLFESAEAGRWLLLGEAVQSSFQNRLTDSGQTVWLAEDLGLAALAVDGGLKRVLWRSLQARMAEAPLDG